MFRRFAPASSSVLQQKISSSAAITNKPLTSIRSMWGPMMGCGPSSSRRGQMYSTRDPYSNNGGRSSGGGSFLRSLLTFSVFAYMFYAMTEAFNAAMPGGGMRMGGWNARRGGCNQQQDQYFLNGNMAPSPQEQQQYMMMMQERQRYQQQLQEQQRAANSSGSGSFPFGK